MTLDTTLRKFTAGALLIAGLGMAAPRPAEAAILADDRVHRVGVQLTENGQDQFMVTIPAGLDQVVFESYSLNGQGDFDLYINRNVPISDINTTTWSSTTAGSENLVLNNPQAGDYFVLTHNAGNKGNFMTAVDMWTGSETGFCEDDTNTVCHHDELFRAEGTMYDFGTAVNQKYGVNGIQKAFPMNRMLACNAPLDRNGNPMEVYDGNGDLVDEVCTPIVWDNAAVYNAFSSPSGGNPEVMAKINDACTFNDQYWDGWAAITNTHMVHLVTQQNEFGNIAAQTLHYNPTGGWVTGTLDTSAYECIELQPEQPQIVGLDTDGDGIANLVDANGNNELDGIISIDCNFPVPYTHQLLVDSSGPHTFFGNELPQDMTLNQGTGEIVYQPDCDQAGQTYRPEFQVNGTSGEWMTIQYEVQ